ncbi:MAG: phosphoribosylformylglycinamidine synthase PurS subunit [Hyphomicrobiaceae bacterium]
MKYLAKVYVTPKPAILDPQGKAVVSSLHSLGYAEVGDVRLGKYMELSIEAADAAAVGDRVDEMCKSLLANEVIEQYRYEVEETSA